MQNHTSLCYLTLDLLETSYLGKVIANAMSLASLRSLIAKCQMLFLEIITDWATFNGQTDEVAAKDISSHLKEQFVQPISVWQENQAPQCCFWKL